MAVQLIATSLFSTVLILMANRGRYSDDAKRLQSHTDNRKQPSTPCSDDDFIVCNTE